MKGDTVLYDNATLFSDNKTIGIYRYNSVPSDAPAEATAYGNLMVIRSGGQDTLSQIYFNHNNHKIFVRSGSSNTTSPVYFANMDWKQLAFTDSSVASATKLQTARTIWGQRFDGSGNVDGIFQLNDIDRDSRPFKIAWLAHNRVAINLWSWNAAGFADMCLGISSDDVSQGSLYFNASTKNWGIGTYTPEYKLDVNGSGRFTDALSAPNINITSTDAIAHLAFGRGEGNFVTMPSGGYVGFISNGKSIATANADLVITDGIVYPGTTGVTKLGFGDKRWSQVSSVDGDFSGALTAGTFSTSSVVACGGRLRINASNSVNSFGFLKATAYTSALNRAVLDIGSNYGGTADITSEAVDVVAMSVYRGTVGVGRAFTYDELYANYNANTKLTVDGNMSITGTFTSTGDQIAGSDIRYKEKVEDIDIPTSVIANAPLFSFKWTDRDDKDVHIGTSAQYWEDKLPEFVKYDPEKDFKHLNYGGLGVSIGISLAKKIEMLEQRIVELEKQLN